MSEEIFQMKDLLETSHSFFHPSGFLYRHQEKAIDYGMLRQTQKLRIINLFRNGPTFTQETLVGEFERIQEQTNQFIQVLLEELATQSKKVREMSNVHEGILRQRNTQARKLAYKNMEITSVSHSQLKRKQDQKKELEKELILSKSISQSYQKQLEGLRRLLNEYQQELELLEKQTLRKNQQAKSKDQSMNRMQKKINQLSQQIAQSKEKQETIREQIKNLNLKITVNRNLGAKLQFTNTKLEQTLKKCHSLQKEKSESRQKVKYCSKIISQLESQLNQSQEKNQLLSQNYLYLKQQRAQQAQQTAKKQAQFKLTLQDLQAKTKNTMQRLKENYQIKIKKITHLLHKQIKSLRMSFKNLKEFAQKQMLVCFRQLSIICKFQSKAFLTSN